MKLFFYSICLGVLLLAEADEWKQQSRCSAQTFRGKCKKRYRAEVFRFEKDTNTCVKWQHTGCRNVNYDGTNTFKTMGNCLSACVMIKFKYDEKTPVNSNVAYMYGIFDGNRDTGAEVVQGKQEKQENQVEQEKPEQPGETEPAGNEGED